MEKLSLSKAKLKEMIKKTLFDVHVHCTVWELPNQNDFKIAWIRRALRELDLLPRGGADLAPPRGSRSSAHSARLIQPYMENHTQSTTALLTCKMKKGGYVTLRHNSLRDLLAKLMEEICKDVVIEPPLLPLTGEMSPHVRFEGFY